jgi:hypothetical protein
LIIDNGVKRETCRSNVEKKSLERKSKKSSNKQNRPSTISTKIIITKRQRQSHKQGIKSKEKLSDRTGKRKLNLLSLEMKVLEELHGKELPSMWIFLKKVLRVVGLLDIASFYFP